MKILSPLFGLVLAGCSVFGVRSGTEEPAYQVIGHAGTVEIRQYAPRLAASVTVQAGQIAARSQGFRRLAGFIFGGNTAASGAAAKIAMTAPVAQSPAGAGWTISFFMPAGYTAASLPRPNDPGIVIGEVPGQAYAVYRFSGTPGVAAEQRARAALLGALAGSAWQAQAAPVAWFYDPPWTLPFARRNELAVLVAAAR